MTSPAPVTSIPVAHVVETVTMTAATAVVCILILMGIIILVLLSGIEGTNIEHEGQLRSLRP